jgi:hypothetical protein
MFGLRFVHGCDYGMQLLDVNLGDAAFYLTGAKHA